MCVSSARPLTSPTANSQSWPGTRRSSPTRSGLPASSPSSSRPIPSVPGLRPNATSSSSLSTLEPSSSASVNAPLRETRVAEAPRRTSTPSSRSDSSTWSLAKGSSRSIRRSPRWTSVTREPSAAQACAISTPTTPPPRIASRAGTSLAVVASRFVQGCDSRSPGIVGHERARTGRDDDRLARDQRLLALDGDLQLAGDACPAAHERDAALLEPRHLRAVVQIADHLVAALEHGRAVDRPELEPGHALRLVGELDRAQQRLGRHAGVERAVAADERCSTIATDTPFSPSRPAATSPAAPAPITTTSNSRMRRPTRRCRPRRRSP